MGQRDELKTQFMTREGLYKLMTLSEYSRPNRCVLWKTSSKLIALGFFKSDIMSEYVLKLSCTKI